MLYGKNVVLGVSGGIAVYKACEIVSRLKKLGANVDVIMTDNAREFVTPLTFQTLAKSAVVTNAFEPVKEFDINHISLAKKRIYWLSRRQPQTSLQNLPRALQTICSPPRILHRTRKNLFAPR